MKKLGPFVAILIATAACHSATEPKGPFDGTYTLVKPGTEYIIAGDFAAHVRSDELTIDRGAYAHVIWSPEHGQTTWSGRSRVEADSLLFEPIQDIWPFMSAKFVGDTLHVVTGRYGAPVQLDIRLCAGKLIVPFAAPLATIQYSELLALRP